jgi:murein DD-endopeptidase MepM/ murein hydrolase activator NlpD
LNQPYFIVVLAHSLHGRIRRFHIDHRVVYAILGLALLGCFTLFGFLSSYARMAWKVANYNSLRQETEFLRTRYQKLLSEANQTTEQMARLQLLATEMTVSYGIRTPAPTTSLTSEGSLSLVPTYTESIEQFTTLRTANVSSRSRGFSRRWFQNLKPSLWPVIGRLMSHFGQRSDPFSGDRSFHAGVDIQVPQGTPVRVTADGIVAEAGWSGGYGKLIVIDHGGGMQTCYAHLSRIDVMPGQEVRVGQVVGGSGSTGRSQAPHVHYEVRIGGSPVNPYPYLAKAGMIPSAPAKRDFGF